MVIIVRSLQFFFRSDKFCRSQWLSLHTNTDKIKTTDMAAQVDGIRRMLLILNKVRREPYISKAALLAYINDKMDDDYGLGRVSCRTLERDLGNIGYLLGYEICFDASRRGYYVNEELAGRDDRLNELLMSFELLNALDSTPNLSSFVLPEHHRPLFSEWLLPLLRAVRDRHPVSFDYVNYRAGCSEKGFSVLPHYLKESNRRWYLLAFDGAVMKTFGVDRIRRLRIDAGSTFERNLSVNAGELFRDCYGIWNDPLMPVEDIELRYDALDGSFVKSVPLHHSQRILSDTPDGLHITLRLRITNDFVMELLSRCRSLEVVKPLHLRRRVCDICRAAMERNAGG